MDFDEKIILQLEKLKKQLTSIENDLSLEEVLIDTKLSARLEKQKKQIAPIVEKYDKLIKLQKELFNIPESEINHFKDEIEEYNKSIESIKNDILNLLISQKNDEQKVTIEIENKSKNTDKLCTFLLKIYENICRKQNFDLKIDKNDIIDNITKKIVLSINGQNCFDILKSENGLHKANSQNVLVTVYPAIEMPKISFEDNDIKIDIYRSNGAGGQNVNKVSTAIRATHIKTGIVTTCQDERSQFQNRQRAIENLKQKVLEKTTNDYSAKQKAEKKKYSCTNIIRCYDFEKNIFIDYETKKEFELDDNQIETNIKSKYIGK